jgi:FkbM family methyltransferase
MKTLKQSMGKMLASIGYELVPHRMAAAIPLRDHLRRLFAHYDVACVVDVGANAGQYGTFLRERVGYTGEIVSFEPVAATFERLASTIRHDRKWRAYKTALGAERTAMPINVTSGSGHSSFLRPDQAAVERTRLESQVRKSRVVRTEQVEVDTLDNVLGGIDAKNIYLKMDTQGYDRRVLEGGRHCVDRFVGLQTEAAMQKLYLEATGYREMTEFVTSLGFRLSGFFPVNHDTDLGLIECDVVFVRPSP